MSAHQRDLVTKYREYYFRGMYVHTVRTNKHEQNTPSRLYQQNILIDLSWRLSEKQS